MYLYFGKDGKLKTKINHDAPPRQGGDLNVTVCLDMDFWDDKERWGVDGDKYWVKTAMIKSASDVLGYPQIATEGQIEVFYKLYNSEIVYDLVPGASYLMYKFRFSAEEVTKIPGQIEFNFSMQNMSFSDNKHVRIGTRSEFIRMDKNPGNGENCISRELDNLTGEISSVVYKKGNGTTAFSDLSPVSANEYQVGTYQARMGKSLTNGDEGFVFVQQDKNPDEYTYGEVSIWMWAKATGAATTCEWIQLPQYSTTDIIPTDGTFAFGVTDITIERTVGYARALIDKEIGIKYQDIMDEFKRVYSKIAIAGTKPDWNVSENTSPSYIYNKPNIKTVLVGDTKAIGETGVYIVKNDTNVKYPILGDYVLLHYADSNGNHIQLVFENQNITWFRSLPSGGKDFGPWKSREIREVLHDGGAPDSATPGIVGQFYVDSSSQYLYYCVSTTYGYEWKQLVNLKYFDSEKKSIIEQIDALKNADEAINGQIANLETSINSLSSDITTITSGLDTKFDKTGGTISGDVTVTGIVSSNEGISTSANISANGSIEGKNLTVHNNAVITGNATIGGSLTVTGAVTSVETTNVSIKDQLFEIAKGDKGKDGLTSPAGFYVSNYDGNGNNLAIVFDKTGTAYVGDVTIGENGLISDTSHLQPFATRQTTEIQDKSILQWDQQSTSLKDSGKTIDDFIEKQENNTGYNCLYGQDVNNNVELVRMSQNKDNNTVPLRTERGTLKGVNAEENDEFVTLQQLDDSESKLSEQVDFLEDKINETIAVNPGKTYILIIGDSVTFTVRNDGVYSVDMGDGTIYSNISNVTKTHNYTRKGSAHIITVSGVGTNGDFGFSLGEDQNLAFRSIHFGEGIKKITNFLVSTPVDVCVLPKTITDVLSDNFTDGNATLKYAKSVYCLSETPFTISKNVFANSLRIFVKRDSLDQYKQAWYQHLPASIIVSEVDSSDLVNEIVQTTGQSTTAVMSQKATTDSFALKSDLIEDTNKLWIDFPYKKGYYLNAGGGLSTMESSYVTDYIPVKTGQKIQVSGYAGAAVALYGFYSDSYAGSNISTYVPEVYERYTKIVEVPDGVKYIVACSFADTDRFFIRIICDYDDLREAKENASNAERLLNYKLNNNLSGVFSENGFISTDGSFVQSEFSRATDYIEITDFADNISFRLAEINGGLMIAFYDKNKKFISGISGLSGNLEMVETTASIPPGAKYYRAVMWNINPTPFHYAKCVYSLIGIVKSIESIIPSAPVYKYGDSLLKPFNFNGKTAIAFGDSITAGVANEGNGNIGAGSNSYINKFATYVGLTLTNRAVSGSTITYADGETLESLYTRISAMTETPDFIIISGGTNDYNQGKELGSFGNTDNTNFYGALYQICEKLKTNNSNATVIFITPINVTKDFNGHDRTLLNNYRNAIYEVATSYGFNVVNGADLVPVTGQTGYDDTIINHVDGCHPTIKGHGLYAKNLCGKLL